MMKISEREFFQHAMMGFLVTKKLILISKSYNSFIENLTGKRVSYEK